MHFVLRMIALCALTNATLHHENLDGTHENKKRYRDEPFASDDADTKPHYPWKEKPSELCLKHIYPACCISSVKPATTLECGAIYDNYDDQAITKACFDHKRTTFLCCRNFYTGTDHEWGIECFHSPGVPNPSKIPGLAGHYPTGLLLLKPGRAPATKSKQLTRTCPLNEAIKDSSDSDIVGCTSDNGDDSIQEASAVDRDDLDSTFPIDV